MATKVVHTIREDKQGLQKQLGCMNGLLQLFDRRYLLGLHRQGSIQKRLTAGEGEKEFKNASKEIKEKNQKKMIIEKNGASVDSSRNSFSSSSCSSTTFSSFDCSKRLQTEWQLPSELTSPNSHKKRPDWSLPPLDIRDVVKESMTRETRVTKQQRVRPVMTHIDSPRPFVHQKTIQYDRKDQNLAKVHNSSSLVKQVKEVSRFSCDERVSQYSLKSTFKVKEPPRLSLDSKQNSHSKSMNGPGSEPGSNKRPSSGVVARLMGLDSLTDSVCEVDQLVSSSPRVQSKTRPALQRHEGCDRARKPSVYGEMEKMLNELKFNTSAKDLRALKQILEAIQMTKTGLNNKEQSLETHKPSPPCSPTVKGTSSPKRCELVNQAMKPTKMATEPKIITGHRSVNRTARKQVNNQTPKKKATDRTPSPKLHKSKNGVEKQCFNGPLSNSVRIKKQSNLKTKHPKIKTVNQMQNTDQPNKNHRVIQNNSFAERLIEDKPMVELTKLSVEQPSPDSVLDAFFIEDTPSPIKNKPNENLHDDQTEWNQLGICSLINNADEDHHSEFSHVKLENNARLIQQTKSLNSTDEKNGDHEYISQILLASGFLNDLDSAIRIVQLHPTSTLIKPELFHYLENSNVGHDKKTARCKPNDTIRRKMIFDSVNELLFHKLVHLDGKLCERFMNGEKLLKEVWSEIDTLQNCSRRCIYDEDEDDDEVINIVSADMNTRSEDWGKYSYEVPSLVLDIERLIFKDLIDEVVNAEVASLQDWPRRHCRRLFST